jgi:septal ring factor EnvC (AmiA/AmiB activator)
VTEFSTPDADADSSRSTGDAPPTDQHADTGSEDRLATLDARLSALERAVSDGETDLHALPDAAAQEARLDELDARVRDVETRLDELDAAVQAVRGYVGAVRAVNREVERRADAALAAADRLAGDDEVADLDLPDQPTETEETTDEPSTTRRAPSDESVEESSPRAEDLAARVRDLL